MHTYMCNVYIDSIMGPPKVLAYIYIQRDIHIYIYIYVYKIHVLLASQKYRP